MKSSMRAKSAALLLSGGIVCGFAGNCVPDNLWANTWGGIVTTTVNTVVQEFVLDPLTGMLVPADEE